MKTLSCHPEFFVSFITKRQSSFSLSPKFPGVFKMSSYLSHEQFQTLMISLSSEVLNTDIDYCQMAFSSKLRLFYTEDFIECVHILQLSQLDLGNTMSLSIRTCYFLQLLHCGGSFLNLMNLMNQPRIASSVDLSFFSSLSALPWITLWVQQHSVWFNLLSWPLTFSPQQQGICCTFLIIPGFTSAAL